MSAASTGKGRGDAAEVVGSGGRPLNGMTWVRILVGATWLDGAAEKFSNPHFPQQFAATVRSGGYVAQAPPFVQHFMRATVVPNAELFANLTRAGELVFGVLLVLGLLTNLAALWSIAFSAMLIVSQGEFGLGEGLGPPQMFSINLVVALLSLFVLLSPAAKSLSLDQRISRGRPFLAPLLTNRRAAPRRGFGK
jgi:thiosulfate dehydrogenase [quinone] large subunit